MKKRFPSPFDMILLLGVIAAVAFSGMLAENKLAETPDDVSQMTEELRMTTQRYTDWELFNTPESYIQTYVVRFDESAAPYFSGWPEPGATLLYPYGNNASLGQLVSLNVISDQPGEFSAEATISCFCNYYKTEIRTTSSLRLRLGNPLEIRSEDGKYLGTGTIVKMN